MHTDNLRDILLRRWQQTLTGFDVDEIAINHAFSVLVDAYATGDRTYHTIKHIYHVLSVIDRLQSYAPDLVSVQLAAWFHDVIYQTQAQNNEEKSAEYAEELLTQLAIPSQIITTVTRLILQTKRHQAAADDWNSQVLLDADLAIFGADSATYWQYAQGIRQEYAWVSTADYITGRTKVLKQFLQRDRIYSTPLMLAMAEQPARAHLAAEIELLQQQKQ